jgi:transcriptional regulator of acetoin/glycerol metabolism
VRELGKVLAVAKVLAEASGTIELAHLPRQIAARVDVRSSERSRRQRPTREQLVALLARHAGDVARVAREIGRQRTLVWRWLREDSVRVDDYRV